MTDKSDDKVRRLSFEIFRFNPEDPESEPHIDTFEIDERPYMTLYMALNEIRETQDGGLQFDFACRSAICGSCGMLVNGRPALGCRTLTADLPETIRLHPLPAFKLIGDLSVNTGKFMRELAERLKLWLHPVPSDKDIHQLEAPMEPEEAAKLYELERCVECGVCVSACATKQMRDTFVGAVGLMKLARFELDSRDARTADDFYHVIGNQDGVFGCMTLLGCQDNCPKDLPHMQQIAYLRRKMALITDVSLF